MSGALKRDQQIERAIEILTDGAPAHEKLMMASFVRSHFEILRRMALDARAAQGPTPETKQRHFIAQAMRDISSCMITISNMLTAGERELPGAIGGITVGLDRAICHLNQRPYEPRDYVATIQAAALVEEKE